MPVSSSSGQDAHSTKLVIPDSRFPIPDSRFPIPLITQIPPQFVTAPTLAQ
ncbi:MAG: hypothetical protein F6K26_46190 [Moorea sp. SIO2I5]|nr:hypothetical protein [Moorena sp. SIO2I5]